MITRFACLLIAVFLTGCAVQQTYTDVTTIPERKAYAACAVTRALLSPPTESSEEARARTAVLQCHRERHAILAGLLEENAGKPDAAEFAAAYMAELDAAMLKHLTLRLAEARQRHPGGGRT